MKAKVIRPFKDIKAPGFPIYQEGATYEGTDERIKELAEGGFVEPQKEAPKPKAGARKRANG